MPITYEIDRVRALVRTTCVGFVTFDEVMAHFAALEADPDRGGELNVLLDVSGLTSTPEISQLREAAARISPERSALRYRACAIVASDDPALVGMGKLFTLFARERFRASTVVRTIHEAEQWLQQPDAQALSVRFPEK